jgi:NAD(P)-dependent dehydrogenase (short-subunit alcohol dehydrogenase family)
VLLVARSAARRKDTAREIETSDGLAEVYCADLSCERSIDELLERVLAVHPTIDVLVNNAGRSIRRSLALSYGRFHDFECTMQLNYFGPVKLILGLLPAMRERRSGQIVNVSTLGVQTNAPKRASAASEFSVERWVNRPLRRKAPQSGRGGATAEQQLWPI